MTPREPKTLVAQAPEIPSLPDIYLRLDQAINDPRYSLNDIGQIIGSDTGLSGRLLRLANSAFYSFPAKIDTITRALTLVGTRQLRDLVLATVVIRAFRKVPTRLVNMQDFWRHSVAVGVAARIIAIYQREVNVEHYYVAGILHDIGRLVHFLLIPDASVSCYEISHSRTIPLFQAEREVLGFDHADTGHALLQEWNLPASLSDPVAHHHRPSQSVAYPREAAILHLADMIANAFSFGSSGEKLVPPLDETAWNLLQIPAVQLDSVLRQIEHQYWTAIDLFLEVETP